MRRLFGGTRTNPLEYECHQPEPLLLHLGRQEVSTGPAASCRHEAYHLVPRGVGAGGTQLQRGPPAPPPGAVGRAPAGQPCWARRRPLNLLVQAPPAHSCNGRRWRCTALAARHWQPTRSQQRWHLPPGSDCARPSHCQTACWETAVVSGVGCDAQAHNHLGADATTHEFSVAQTHHVILTAEPPRLAPKSRPHRRTQAGTHTLSCQSRTLPGCFTQPAACCAVTRGRCRHLRHMLLRCTPAAADSVSHVASVLLALPTAIIPVSGSCVVGRRKDLHAKPSRNERPRGWHRQLRRARHTSTTPSHHRHAHLLATGVHSAVDASSLHCRF